MFHKILLVCYFILIIQGSGGMINRSNRILLSRLLSDLNTKTLSTMAVIRFKIPFWYEITSGLYSKSQPVGCVVVKDVIDGDTFVAVRGSQRFVVRLLGIDSPELGQPYGINARCILSRLILNKEVQLSWSRTGKYHRTVALVTCDSLIINREMVRLGAAWVYEVYCPTTFKSQWRRLQYEAKRDSLGLWKYANPVPPHVWRELY